MKAIEITDSEIYIQGHLFARKDFSLVGKELIIDAISKGYTGQRLRVSFWDGENVEFTGFLEFIKYICQCFSIPHDQVLIESHSPNITEFPSKVMLPGIFLGIGQHLNFTGHNCDNGKFVGTLLGRSNPTRLRLAYEIDQTFPNDNYTVFQPQLEQVRMEYSMVNDLYQKELSWLATKQFDRDIHSRSPSGGIGWQDSIATYANICNNYKIEIISETDAFSNYWLTEKTGRCLAIGKPFILIAGQHSLEKLRQRGFQTFHDIIDEVYDYARTPTDRIRLAMISLNTLHEHKDKDTIIKQMYEVAAQNVEIFKEYSSTQRET